MLHSKGFSGFSFSTVLDLTSAQELLAPYGGIIEFDALPPFTPFMHASREPGQCDKCLVAADFENDICAHNTQSVFMYVLRSYVHLYAASTGLSSNVVLLRNTLFC